MRRAGGSTAVRASLAYWDGWVWTGPFQLINEHTACAPVVSASTGDSPMASGTGLAANRCWCPGQLPISNLETGG